MRHLLVLDMDLLAVDEKLGLEPINYLLASQKQEPCEVVVLSLASTRQARLPAWELLLGTSSNVTKFPVAPRPDHDIGAAAEHRMNLAVRHLRMIGCQASGIISDEELVTAVRSETRVRDYDEVILATGGQPGTWMARVLRRDPAHRLRSRLGQRLIVFLLGTGVLPCSLGHRPDTQTSTQLTGPCLSLLRFDGHPYASPSAPCATPGRRRLLAGPEPSRAPDPAWPMTTGGQRIVMRTWRLGGSRSPRGWPRWRTLSGMRTSSGGKSGGCVTG